MGQTVNLLSSTSVVRIHLPPPAQKFSPPFRFRLRRKLHSGGNFFAFHRDSLRWTRGGETGDGRTTPPFRFRLRRKRCAGGNFCAAVGGSAALRMRHPPCGDFAFHRDSLRWTRGGETGDGRTTPPFRFRLRRKRCAGGNFFVLAAEFRKAHGEAENTAEPKKRGRPLHAGRTPTTNNVMKFSQPPQSGRRSDCSPKTSRKDIPLLAYDFLWPGGFCFAAVIIRRARGGDWPKGPGEAGLDRESGAPLRRTGGSSRHTMMRQGIRGVPSGHALRAG